MGSSNDVQVGQPVVALGAPLGLSSTVTSGIVSALDRTVAVPADDGKTALLVSAVQTDAAINPGNSGGALVNCAAELVGVPTAGATVPSPTGQSSPGNVGLGFAIPVDLAKAIADELIATGTVTHAFFGVQVAAIPPQVAEEAGAPKGLFVQGAVSGGPAASAGLRVGDIITNIDGQPATDPQSAGCHRADEETWRQHFDRLRAQRPRLHHHGRLGQPTVNARHRLPARPGRTDPVVPGPACLGRAAP